MLNFYKRFSVSDLWKRVGCSGCSGVSKRDKLYVQRPTLPLHVWMTSRQDCCLRSRRRVKRYACHDFMVESDRCSEFRVDLEFRLGF